jgi:pimeloyl-ACP methyl ester carboxylesterase
MTERRLAPFEQLPFAEVPDLPRVAHPYMNAEARTIAVKSSHFGDVNVHVRVFGTGPPLLLLHGLMTTSYSFRNVLEPLGKRFTLYVPDLLGAGRSDKPRVRYTPDALAASVGDTMKALDIWGAPAIGNSMGGYLLMRLALREPSAMSRLVNLHSPGVPTARMRALGAAFTIVPRVRPLIAALVRRNPERWVHQNVHYWDETLKSREEHREYASALMSDGGLEAFASMLGDTLDATEMARFATELRARKDARQGFPIPLLLVYARRDKMVPPVVGTRLSELVPDAKLIWLEAASHFAHVDAPIAFLDAAISFLDGPERVIPPGE